MRSGSIGDDDLIGHDVIDLWYHYNMRKHSFLYFVSIPLSKYLSAAFDTLPAAFEALPTAYEVLSADSETLFKAIRSSLGVDT